MDWKRNIWTPAESDLFKRLNTPRKIQDFLDDLPYDPTDGYRSARQALKNGKDHCFGGSMIACAALRYHGEKPLILGLVSEKDDEDHVITIYRKNTLWGAISKSKFAVLRFRDPVYTSIRELVMTYFEFYFNSKGKKTLRQYSSLIDLTKYDDEWMISEEHVQSVDNALCTAKHYGLLSSKTKKQISKVDNDLLKLGFIGVDKTQYPY